MSIYAKLDGTRIVGVLETDFVSEPEYIELTEPIDWSQRPSPHHQAHWVDGSVTWLDPRTLQERKADRWAAIRAERDAREYGGFAWAGSVFDSDAESQRRIQGAAQLAMLSQQLGQPFSIVWTLADNSTRTLSGVDMLAVGVALSEHVGALHAAARTLRQQLDAASTAEQVEAVAWP